MILNQQFLGFNFESKCFGKADLEPFVLISPSHYRRADNIGLDSIPLYGTFFLFREPALHFERLWVVLAPPIQEVWKGSDRLSRIIKVLFGSHWGDWLMNMGCKPIRRNFGNRMRRSTFGVEKWKWFRACSSKFSR